MNAEQNLAHSLDTIGRTSPDRVGSFECGRSATWLELASRCASAAADFRVRGLCAGDRIAILALNSQAYLEAVYASVWAGLVVVPLNTRWSAAELSFALEDCHPRALIHDDLFSDLAVELTRKAPNLTLRYTLDGGKDSGSVGWRHITCAPKGLAVEPVASDDLAGIFYTGGTTGFPKGVCLTHGNLRAGCGMVAEALRLNSANRYLHVAPMFHLADAAMIFAVTETGGAHGYLERFDPDLLTSRIEAEDITDITLVPTMIARWTEAASFDPSRIQSLRRIIYGAAPMSEALLSLLGAKLPKVGLVQAYGQTELAPVATVLDERDHRRGKEKPEILRSAGKPVRGVELRIVDQDGNPCEPGNVGEILVRGPNATKGYWHRPEETAAAIVGGWVHTGDLGRFDGEGYVYVVDRAKDMIISGGENVYSAEVENVISGHPGVVECAVIGVPDPDLVERVHAVVVVSNPGLTDQELVSFCRGRLGGFKLPRSTEIRLEPLPRSAAGKVLKTELRTRVEAARA